MRFPRFQFTLRQLIKLVVLSAVFFALMGTPAGPWILLVGLVLPGFAIDRARGGTGILGAILAGAVEFLVVGMIVDLGERFFGQPYDRISLLLSALVFLGVGLVWGLVVGFGAWVSVPLVNRLIGRQLPLNDESCSPIVWRGFDNRIPGRANKGHEPWHSPVSHSDSDSRSG